MRSENSNHDSPLLKVNGLKVHFSTAHGTAKAVDGISFHVSEGESLEIVGESGCGKSVTALSILKLIPQPPGKIVAGQALWDGKDLLTHSENKMRDVRGKQISMIFQEPMTSLNPVFTIGFQLFEMFRLQMGLGKKQAWEKSVEMLKLVHIPAPDKRIKEYPHELSGGMRQRVMIAMALACKPRLLIADEPTTALDVTIQAQILELMQELKQKLGMAMMLITHDLGIVANSVERIAVMYAGKIVEEGDVYSIFEDPRHPYTQGLLKAVPRMDHEFDAQARRLFEIRGMVPSLHRLPRGCNFYARCDRKMDCCKFEDPVAVVVKTGHSVSCWLESSQEASEG